eukprot:g68507.t1
MDGCGAAKGTTQETKAQSATEEQEECEERYAEFRQSCLKALQKRERGGYRTSTTKGKSKARTGSQSCFGHRPHAKIRQYDCRGGGGIKSRSVAKVGTPVPAPTTPASLYRCGGGTSRRRHWLRIRTVPFLLDVKLKAHSLTSLKEGEEGDGGEEAATEG